MTDKQPIYAELPADRYSKSGNVTDTGWYNIHDLRAFADATHALRTQAQPVGDDAEAAARRSFPQWWSDMGASLCGVDPLASSPPQTYAARGFMGGYVAALAAQAPQQAAPAAEWLEQAYREGWAACRDAETIGEEAEDWAFGNSTANSRMIDMQQAAPQQEVQIRRKCPDELAEPVYIRTLCKALDAALDFAGTVAGGSSWWQDVWAELDVELETTRENYWQAQPAPSGDAEDAAHGITGGQHGTE